MTTISGELKIPSIFGDHMVLRRNVPIKVWGKSKNKVTVTLGDEHITADVQDGMFLAALSPLPASGPYEMIITDGIDTVIFKDVMVGEVWLCGGQSNMEWQLNSSANGREDAKEAKDDYLRLFNVAHIATYDPLEDVCGYWERSSEATSLAFSAVGYYFAKKLREELNITVGIINSSWGGTIIEAWTGKEAMESVPMLKEIADEYEAYMSTIGNPKQAYETIMSNWKKTTAFATNSIDISNIGYSAGYASSGYQDDDLKTIDVPSNWFDQGIEHHGVVWFRKLVNIPLHFAEKDLILHLTAVDKSDVTYFNNTLVGSMRIEDNRNSWATPRKYLVPKEIVREGLSLIAVRVFSNIFSAGFVNGDKNLMYLSVANGDENDRIDISGEWKYIIEQDYGYNASMPKAPYTPPGPENPNLPYALCRSMIDPIAPYAISGVIWYQGESNAESKEDALSYRVKLPTMIADWRQKFDVGDFPFYIVELANFNTMQIGEQFYNWAILRESQYMTTKSVKNCDMTTIIDIGDSCDIHPTNKHDVGSRLARLALNHDYDFKDIALKGPVFRSMEIDGSKAILNFDYVYAGFEVKGDDILSFKIAGDDKQFLDADAKIEGDKIIVWSDSVKSPTAVRYAFEADPICNLFNSEELPVTPFRTDKY